MLTIILIIIISLVVGGIIAYFIITNSKNQTQNKDFLDLQKSLYDSLNQATQNINQTLQNNINQMDKRSAQSIEQVARRLQENNKAIDESKNFLTSRVNETEKTVREVTNKLSQLEEASTKLLQTNKEIVSFQNMLKVPKVRGSFGELLLENLLADTMPSKYYKMQYTFTSGEICDAVIILLDNKIVGVDSKFPLENFEKYFNEENEIEKEKLYKVFIRDVKSRIDEISKKYVSPQDNTLNFAMMYVPMESIYYDIVVRRDNTSTNIWEYAYNKRVIPVSPNSFLSYLYTILEGLKGYQIEEKAAEILKDLTQLKTDFVRFEEDFGTLGKHLGNARNKYDDTSKKLDKLVNKIDTIEARDLPEIENN